MRERLSAGVDANELIEVALAAFSEREAVRQAVDSGWEQADSKQFVETDVDSVMRRAAE
mgnify:FL=1